MGRRHSPLPRRLHRSACGGSWKVGVVFPDELRVGSDRAWERRTGDRRGGDRRGGRRKREDREKGESVGALHGENVQKYTFHEGARRLSSRRTWCTAVRSAN